RGQLLEPAGDVGRAVGVLCEAVGPVWVGAARAPGPEHVALGGVPHDEDVVVAGAGDGEVAERGRGSVGVPEAAGDVDVPRGAHGDLVARVGIGAPAAAGPEHVALGGELQEGDVHLPDAGEGERVEGGRPAEVGGEVEVPFGVQREARAEVV